jgi:hypothetical protein
MEEEEEEVEEEVVEAEREDYLSALTRFCASGLYREKSSASCNFSMSAVGMRTSHRQGLEKRRFTRSFESLSTSVRSLAEAVNMCGGTNPFMLARLYAQ